MFLNKHYEIPFVKECVARFPLPYFLIAATEYIALQESIHYEIPFVRSIPCSSTSPTPEQGPYA